MRRDGRRPISAREVAADRKPEVGFTFATSLHPPILEAFRAATAICTKPIRRLLLPLIGWIVAAAIGCTIALPAVAASIASPQVESIVVRLRGVDPANGPAPLSANDQVALYAALRTPFSLVGHTREGAFRLQLQQPLPLEVARAAINRIRLLPTVVYANVSGVVEVESANASAATAAAREAAARHPPVGRLIVKYREATGAAGANRDPKPAASAIDRVSALAGQPVVHERAMSGGAHVLRLFQALPVDQAVSLARYLEADSSIEYVEPDLRMQPLLLPNDPEFVEQWHYLGPPAEMGGTNLPPDKCLIVGL